MNAYLAIFTIRAKTVFHYRTAAFAGMCTQFFWGLVVTMILKAFYHSTPAQENISLAHVLTFVWVGQALVTLIPWSLDKEIEAQIKQGHVAYELVRPIHLYRLWFTKSLATCAILPLMRSIPIFVLAGLFCDLSAPSSFIACCAFCFSLVLAALLSASVSTLAVVSLFWTLSGEGIKRLLPTLSLFLSGITLPLPLFPEWMHPFLLWQPFRGIMDIPCRLYTGMIPLEHIPFFLGFQLFWIILLLYAGHVLMKKALKHFVIQGG